MQNPEFWDDAKALIDYYQTLPVCASGLADKSHFNPMKIRTVLNDFVLMERITDLDIRIRIMGEQTLESLKSNPTGRNIFDIYAPADQAIYNALYKTITDHPCGLVFKRKLILENNIVHEGSTLYVPLQTPEGQVFYAGVTKKVVTSYNPDIIAFQAKSDYFDVEATFIDIGQGVPDKASIEAIPGGNVNIITDIK